MREDQGGSGRMKKSREGIPAGKRFEKGFSNQQFDSVSGFSHQR
jgi:hypothetical protein